jgi:archaellum component FlaC
MRKSFKVLALAVSSSVLLSACQTTSGAGDRPLTPAEQRMREQADTYNQTMLEGAATGCAAGAVTGLAVALLGGGKHKGKNALVDSAIGCAAGAVIGGGVGAYVADKQEKYANKEQQLDSMISDVRAENQRLAGLITATQQVIADDKARMDQIDTDLAAGKLSMEQAKKKMASVDDNRAYLDKTLAELKKRKDTYAEAAKQTASGASKAKADAMNAEITTLQKQIAQLEAERDSLVQRRTVSRVG